MNGMTKAANGSVLYKETPKKTPKGLDNIVLYIMNVPCVYASVHEPKENPNSNKKEFSITVFLTEEQREVVEDKLLVNKSFFEVGRDKNKKKKIKYPLSTQLTDEEREAGKISYDEFEGRYGVVFSLDELTRQGKPQVVDVVGSDRQPFKDLVGNGSVVSVKLWGYANNDGQYNVRLKMVRVDEHVPYDGGSDDSMVIDDVFGVSYEREVPKPKQKDNYSKESEDEEFDEIPFDADDFE